MRFGRHLRRLHARWRLHRMEWNNMHRPLEPPPGYEKYYELSEIFPGLKGKGRETWKRLTYMERMKALRLAFRISKHYWFPDPEVHKILQDYGVAPKEMSWEEKIDQAQEAVESGVDSVQGLKKAAEKRLKKSAKILSKDFKEVEPDLRELGKQRIGVMQEALKEFSEGYAEASSGKFRAPWEMEEDIVSSSTKDPSDPSETPDKDEKTKGNSF